MGKRIVIRTTDKQPAKAERPAESSNGLRRDPRRSGLPRRIQPDRRHRRSANEASRSERRLGIRRSAADRRRHRDRRFGLDPTLYDRLVDLDL